ncbi:MAG: sulfite exporter TauE/SafE family protein, partial [Solirubrobacterales bacterium]
PAMTIVLSKGQVEAESTSLLMIALVSVIGTWRQRSYGNVNMKDAAVIGLLSPVGVLVGVVVANAVPERALKIGFAALALYMAWRLLRRVFKSDDPPVPLDTAAPGTGPSSP